MYRIISIGTQGFEHQDMNQNEFEQFCSQLEKEPWEVAKGLVPHLVVQKI